MFKNTIFQKVGKFYEILNLTIITNRLQ